MDVIEIRLKNLQHLEAQIRATVKTQKSAAIQLGVSPSYLNQLLSGKKMGDDVARKIETARDLPRGWMDTPQWLRAKVTEPLQAYEIRAVDGPDGVDTDREVMVPEVDVELGAGNGVALEFVETRYRLPYQIEWLRSVGVRKPEEVRLMAVRGHSMERTLFEGDKVLVHLTNKRVVSDAVYAIMLDGEPRVKRLFRSADGIRVVSDNEDKVKYPDETVTAEQADRLIIIGRAIHRQGSKGAMKIPRLDRPVKRVAVLVLCVGVAMMLIGAYPLINVYGSDAADMAAPAPPCPSPGHWACGDSDDPLQNPAVIAQIARYGLTSDPEPEKSVLERAYEHWENSKIHAVFLEPNSSEYRRWALVRWGVLVACFGLLFSYLYDAGIGRIVRWICEPERKAL